MTTSTRTPGTTTIPTMRREEEDGDVETWQVAPDDSAKGQSLLDFPLLTC